MDYKTTKSKIKVGSNKTNNYTEFFHKAFRNILLISAPLTIISAIILSLPHSSAYSSSTDSVALTLPSSCTISASVVTPHNITLVNGQKQDDIGNTKINAYCNDDNGYFIYAIGSSNDIAGNTDLISSINDNYNIHTGIYPTTLTTSTPSSWAMKLSSNNGTYAPTIIPSYTNYTTVPNTDTIVAYRASGTSMDINTDLTGSYFNTTYQIYTNSIQPAGTYLGKVKYTMTHPYNASQLPNIENAFDIAGVDKVNVPGVGNYYAMQDMTDRICGLVGVRGDLSAAQLVDIRDNKLYWVAKLDDDNCWMTQNLDFDIVADEQDPTKMKTLTSEDTDLTDHSLTGAYSEANEYSYDPATGITSWTPASTAKTINFESTAVTGWQSSSTVPYSASKTDDTNTGHASLGNYYNWTAAIASNNSDTLTNDTLNNISQNPQNSICPKGWRLPTASNDNPSLANSTNEFARLNYLYNNGSINTSAGLMESPLYFIKAGRTNGSIFEYGNTQGFYWSSTNSTSTFAYTFGLSGSSVTINGGQAAKNTGRSLRCLAR